MGRPNLLDIIEKKKAGLELTAKEIERAILEFTRGEIPDYQVAAFLMAVYFQGMSRRETLDMIRTMLSSGKRADLSGIDARKVDKHSTGGVGDKISLIIAPIVASQGVVVPMISGRGLAHTGGTLDKLESIPGLRTSLSVAEFERQVNEIGCVLAGQNRELVPADQKLYALRDVTGTVGSVPLITASILSKKIAEGIDALLLDVKFGSGAFYQEVSEARKLGKNLVAVGEEFGLEVQAILTDMDQPLGLCIGNALEVEECLKILKGEKEPSDLYELSMTEAALMLILAGKASDFNDARILAEESLESGTALEKFRQIVQWQGGDLRFIDDPSTFAPNSFKREVSVQESGIVQKVDALIIGQAAMLLGAGRIRQEDSIDPWAGIVLHEKRGDQVEKGKPLATLFSSTENKLDHVLSRISTAFLISQEPVERRPLVLSEITKHGEKLWEG